MSVSSPLRHRWSLSRSFPTTAGVSAVPALAAAAIPSIDELDSASSPERMLLSSLSLCLSATFERLAAREHIALVSWDAEASGTVERTPEGWMFTSIVLELDIALAGALDDATALRAEELLERAKQACLVLNSLRAPVVVEAQIRGSEGAADRGDDASRFPPLLPPLRPRLAAERLAA